MIKFEVKQPMFTGVPAEIALAMYEVLMEQEELIDRGERCDKCGELHLPEDLTQGLCDECLMELAEEMAEEMIAEQVAALVEEIVEELMEEQEERELEEVAKFVRIAKLLADDFPIDLRIL